MALTVKLVIFGVFGVGLMSFVSSSSSKFDELFQPSWALDHFSYEGEILKLKLDNYSGLFALTKSLFSSPGSFTLFCF